jgi:CxxC motif-containing protein (DUF1111 family)
MDEVPMERTCRLLVSVFTTGLLIASLNGCGEKSVECTSGGCMDILAGGDGEGTEVESQDETILSSPGDTGDDTPSTDDIREPDGCETPSLTPLYDELTLREPDVLVDSPDALVSHVADRARDRHAREDIVNGTVFRKYDHYLPFYWEQRIANLEIIDRVAKGGSGITVNFMTLAELNPAEFRTFYGNTSSVALYHNNMSDYSNMGVTLVSTNLSSEYPGETEFHYSATLTHQFPEHRPLELGDRVEIELSQFLLEPRNGRSNYYGTAILYVVGEGVVPWYAREREEAVSDAARAQASFDSFPVPRAGWLGGRTTLPYHYSNEPEHRFKQMAGNISTLSGHAFMHGRRLHHTDFSSGRHSESDNPIFSEQANKAGPIAVTHSCVSCHINNGRDVAPSVGALMHHAVVKVGGDELGSPHPELGDSIQPLGEYGVSDSPIVRIEAEDYAEAHGVQTESTSDEGGGLNVGYTDAGDRIVYDHRPVSIDSAGDYVFVARVASDVGGGQIRVTGVGGSPVYGGIDVPNTGGWQAWTTAYLPLELDAGEYAFELYVESGGWNLNWFEVRAADGSSAPEGAVILADYELVEGMYGDGERYTLRRPSYAFEGAIPERYSVRLAPQLVGLGLLEAVDDGVLVALADPCDEDGDAISGRVRAVPAHASPDALQAGRFGLKAGQPSVLRQIGAALNRDMGVTTSLYPRLDQETEVQGEPELASDELELMRRYVSLLGVPARRALSDSQALRGEALFGEASCDSCHTPTLQTGAHHPYAELRNQTIHPFTDLLLHDMGPALADSLEQPDVAASEWRTPSLWGIGLTAGVSGLESYLHDGRARTLEEAILWHGGEAEASKEVFRQMPREAREALVTFLKSL